MWDHLAVPMIIAHRGDEGCAPENTLAAFSLAVKKGTDAIEYDVKLTADQQVIVIHDQTVDRTTDGSGDVSKIPLAGLREFNAGVLFPGKFNDEKIPTLDEVFETVGKLTMMNIELKNYGTPTDNLVTKVVDVIQKHGMQNKILFSSFLPTNLRKARNLLPQVPCGLLIIPGWRGILGRHYWWRGQYEAVHPGKGDTSAEFVERVHAAGKKVITWTISTEEQFHRFIPMGVDGIITGNLDLALRMREKSRKEGITRE